MFDPLLFALLLLAIACGWLLGRFSGKPKAAKHRSASRVRSGDRRAGPRGPDYFAGINYLLNDQPDGAIDAFLAALEVNNETIETHLALGSLLRRRGEVDRAIRIHQNLLARPSLTPQQHCNVKLQLAKNYHKAGWLDRAENLLQEIRSSNVPAAGDARRVARQDLQSVYEQEQEWQQALTIVAERIDKHRGANGSADQLRTAAAHYCCELAQQQLQARLFKEADGHLKKALRYDSRCVRAGLLRVDMLLQQDKTRPALRQLNGVLSQNPARVAENLDLVERVFTAAGKPAAVLDFLNRAYATAASTPLAVAIYKHRLATNEEGADAALIKMLHDAPDVAGLEALIRSSLSHSAAMDGKQNELLAVAQSVLATLSASSPAYECDNCGFAGMQLHWHCPSCRQWDTIYQRRRA